MIWAVEIRALQLSSSGEWMEMTYNKKMVPRPFRIFLSHLRRMVVYQNYDSSKYWRDRASMPDQAAVLWLNQEYNALYRNDQRTIIEPWVKALPSDASILDIGCGVGVVSSMISSMRSDVHIDGVDFEEMISVASQNAYKKNIRYISSPAEIFRGDGSKYDLIVSSACYSSIRNIDSLKRALDNAAYMLNGGGTLLLIDPFHRWNYLARAKFGSKDVISHLKRLDLYLLKKSGVLFWPYRIRLANSNLNGSELKAKYLRGERLLGLLGRHFWADYKVLIFRKG